jgi:hypothetical protein
MDRREDTIQGLPFAVEFPHLAALGQALRRYAISLVASILVLFVCAGLGLSDFLRGWFAGCTLFNVLWALTPTSAAPPNTSIGKRDDG